MVLQAYLDDSDTHGSARKAFVLGGYIATAEAWTKFAAEWEPLLETFKVGRGKSGRRRFKMNEMAHHMEDVPPFFEIISRHVIGAISIVIYEDDLERAKSRIWSDNVDILFSPDSGGRNVAKKYMIHQLYHLMNDPSILAYGLKNPARFRDALAANRDRIDLYFDTDSSDDWAEWWEAVQKGVDEDVRGTRPPQFVDDEDYLPLQAADFWSWWTRYGHENDKYVEIAQGDFGAWQVKYSPPSLSITIDEDALTEQLINEFYEFVPIKSSVNIYDAKKKPRTDHAMPVHHMKKKSAMFSHYERLLKLLRGR